MTSSSDCPQKEIAARCSLSARSLRTSSQPTGSPRSVEHRTAGIGRGEGVPVNQSRESRFDRLSRRVGDGARKGAGGTALVLRVVRVRVVAVEGFVSGIPRRRTEEFFVGVGRGELVRVRLRPTGQEQDKVWKRRDPNEIPVKVFLLNQNRTDARSNILFYPVSDAPRSSFMGPVPRPRYGLGGGEVGGGWWAGIQIRLCPVQCSDGLDEGTNGWEGEGRGKER